MQKQADALSSYENVLSMHVSSKLSGNFQAAVNAAEEVDKDRITVFDTETVTVPIGATALQLSRLARKGAGLEELLHRLEEMRRHSKFYCILETLEFSIN